MARFQALTNPVLDSELEGVRIRLGLLPSQKAELLRELATIVAWIVKQSERGRTIEARRGAEVEELTHPVLDRLRTESEPRAPGHAITLSDEELRQLAEVLERPFEPTPALRKVLGNLAHSSRRPPKIRWKSGA
jgi:hypothetical protein